MKETSKSIVRRLYDVRYATRFFVGAGIDIGAGTDPLSLYGEQFPLMKSVRVWDMPDGDAQKLATVADESLDFVHSSHCLEHMVDPLAAMRRWFEVLKPGGHMVLLFPDEDMYEQGTWPSNKNTDHKWTFTIAKARSWSAKSLNVIDLVAKMPAAAELLKLEKLDTSYRYNLPPFDQTLTPVGECSIEIVLRKRQAAEISAGGRLPPRGQLTRRDILYLTGLDIGRADAPKAEPAKTEAPAAAIDARLQEAVVRHQARDFAAAEAIYREILARQPQNFDATHLLGVLHRQRGDSAGAVALIRRALTLEPRSSSAYGNLGNALRDVGKFDEALASLDAAIALRPDAVEVYCQRGNVLRDLRRPAEALAAFETALSLRREYPDALVGRGSALGDLDRHAEALANYDAALALQPDHADALNNRGVALRALDRPEEAVQSYNAAIRIRADFHDAMANRGVALGDMGRYDEALEGYARVLAVKPGHALARLNAAMCRLVKGDYAAAWPDYEWRWQANGFAKPEPGVPPWTGDRAIAGKRVLLHAEQGLGDTIQFARYAANVAALGAHAVLEVQPALKSLFAGMAGVDTLIAQGEKRPPFDLHCPLLSLPLAFGTTLETIPAAVPYLRAGETRAREWLAKLGPKNRKRIGLVWSGSTGHKNDRNRSIPLATLAPLLALDADFVSLQKETRASDRALLDANPAVAQFGDSLGDFADTAALIAAMDLVVSVDTSVLHLAAAMGKPVFALLPFNPDWRWLLGRDDSPWYPGMRLFRQAKRGDWANVVETVGSAIRKML